MRNPFSEGNCKCQTGSKRKKKTKLKGQKGGVLIDMFPKIRPPTEKDREKAKKLQQLYGAYKTIFGKGKKSKAQNGGLIGTLKPKTPIFTTPGFPSAQYPNFRTKIMY